VDTTGRNKSGHTRAAECDGDGADEGDTVVESDTVVERGSGVDVFVVADAAGVAGVADAVDVADIVDDDAVAVAVVADVDAADVGAADAGAVDAGAVDVDGAVAVVAVDDADVVEMTENGCPCEPSSLGAHSPAGYAAFHEIVPRCLGYLSTREPASASCQGDTIGTGTWSCRYCCY